MASAEILRLRRKAEERVDLAVREELDRWGRLARDPTDVVDRVEPDMSGHDGDEHMMGRLQARHANFFALQIRDAADAFVPEQFIATDMHAGQDDDRLARSHAHN